MAVLNKAKKKFSDLLREKDFTLWEILEQIKKRGLDIWVPLLTTDRGSHSGFPHLQSVEENANLLVPDEIKDTFSSGEIFLLLSAIFLHDIGRIIDNEEHNEHSYWLIKEHWAEWGLPDERIAEYCAIIALFHGINEPESNVTLEQSTVREQVRLQEYYTVSLSPYGTLRIPLLATILRVADETDNHWKRAIREFIINRSKGKKSDLIKWFRNFIDDVEFCIEGECILLHIPKNKLLKTNDGLSKDLIIIDEEEIKILNNSRRDIAIVLRNWKSFLSEYDLKYKNVFFDYNNLLLTELKAESNVKKMEKLQQALDNARREFMYPHEPVLLFCYLSKMRKILFDYKDDIVIQKGKLIAEKSKIEEDDLKQFKLQLTGFLSASLIVKKGQAIKDDIILLNAIIGKLTKIVNEGTDVGLKKQCEENIGNLQSLKTAFEGIEKSDDEKFNEYKMRNIKAELVDCVRRNIKLEREAGEFIDKLTDYRDQIFDESRFIMEDIQPFLSDFASWKNESSTKPVSKVLSKYLLASDLNILSYFKNPLEVAEDIKDYYISIVEVIIDGKALPEKTDTISTLARIISVDVREMCYKIISGDDEFAKKCDEHKLKPDEIIQLVRNYAKREIHEAMISKLYGIMFTMYRSFYNSKDVFSKKLSVKKGQITSSGYLVDIMRYKFSNRLSKKSQDENLRVLLNAIVKLYLGSLGNRWFTWEALEAETGRYLESRDKWLAERINLASKDLRVIFHGDNRLFIRFDPDKLNCIYKELGVEYEK